MNYWLLKSEPDVFSIDDLKGTKKEPWDGVRNYQARNNLQAMQKGDLALFYHSRTDPPHVAGLCKIVKEAYPDKTAFDPTAKYYDPKSNKKNPRWFCPDVSYLCHFPATVSIGDIKGTDSLQEMALVKNSRLSVQPLTKQEFEKICQMGGLKKIPSRRRG